MKNIYYLICSIAVLTLIACSSSENTNKLSMDSYEITTLVARGDGDISVSNDNTGSITQNDLTAEAGVLTAGEWSDLSNWDFWQSLMQKEMFFEYQSYWHFFPTQRYSVRLKDKMGEPVMDAKVTLLDKQKKVLWAAKTNNMGVAELWAQPFSEEKDLENTILITYDNNKFTLKKPHTYVKGVNDFEMPMVVVEPDNKVDLMFVVDATGSMEDEIAYLKKELEDVVGKVKTAQPNLSLQIGSVFYRDKGDDYITRAAELSTDVASTIGFIEQQSANGGGDYPEAVDAALLEAIENQKWSPSARTRMLFLMLDAPPHHNDKSLAKLQQVIRKSAELGIKIVPIASSGIDKDTEFLMRFFALATNGSYVFMTDHSGVGNSHVEPTVGEYKVEYLNDLLTRMIIQSIQPHADLIE